MLMAEVCPAGSRDVPYGWRVSIIRRGPGVPHSSTKPAAPTAPLPFHNAVCGETVSTVVLFLHTTFPTRRHGRDTNFSLL